MEPHEGRLTLLGSPHAATSPSPVSLAGERPDPRHGPAAEAGQDPTEHARPLAAASGRSRASRSGRAGVAQVRGPGAGTFGWFFLSGSLNPSFPSPGSSFETPHSPGPCRTALGHLGRTSGGRGNFLGNGYRGEDGNGELPARRVCRLERHQLKTPERCLQLLAHSPVGRRRWGQTHHLPHPLQSYDLGHQPE
ncbi:uncharacterized protein LOC129649798 isoform X3 [Bubalus kerabau]|uniref:uncharacterized protein LOC129649798 isoform X3 n=1 Tax=Bubalus carabanensis TaxID=3119969 RepID=UPI00244E8AD5|nr:uncharacterized protein LOC129649798 isoform X3 [Bubalus carabanensis]